jgi:hypothetical protein
MSERPQPVREDERVERKRCEAPTPCGANGKCERRPGHEGEHGGRSMSEVIEDAHALERHFTASQQPELIERSEAETRRLAKRGKAIVDERIAQLEERAERWRYEATHDYKRWLEQAESERDEAQAMVATNLEVANANEARWRK